MTKYKKIIILLNLLLLVIYFIWATKEKESTLKNGQLVLLELAPVDPRSLMQGDYMQLRYRITDRIQYEIPEHGYYVLSLDHNHVGTIQHIQEDKVLENENEVLVKYKSSGRQIGAESYFFEEGSASKYEKAKYGGLKVDKQGNSILVGLYDDQCRLIE